MEANKLLTSDHLCSLAYDYVFATSRQKKYNPQTLANYKYCTKYGKKRITQILSLSVEEFCKSYEIEKVKDLVYKNDYFTPRNMHLVSPIYYLYYTSIVFKISYLFSNDIVDLSNRNISSFYSGYIDFRADKKDIKKLSSFNKSYSNFQRKRKSFFGNPVLAIDLQNFFECIKSNHLITKLKRMFGNKKCISDLEYFLEYCRFDSLPQLHYSIASSVLSQLYLVEFDDDIQKILERDNIFLIRFVDDMYFIHTNAVASVRKNNELLNEISFYLWKQGLSMNTSKTKMLSAEEFQSGFDVVDQYGDLLFSSETIIEEKANEVVKSGLLLNFVDDLCKLEQENGIDLLQYQRILQDNLSINGDDANKVLRNIIYSKKWEELDIKHLKQLIKKWKYILFNPSDLTVLYIMVYRFLEYNGFIDDNGGRLKKVLNYLFKNTTFTLRDSLVAITYLFQSNFRNKELLNKVGSINDEYIRFIEKYVISN